MMKKILYIFVGLAVVLGVISSIYASKKPDDNSNPTFILQTPVLTESSTQPATSTSSISTAPEPNSRGLTSRSDLEVKPLELPNLPDGATWHPLGGIERTNCEQIVDADIREKCTGERAIANYIYSIVPNAQITKGFCYPGTAFDDPVNWQLCTDLSELQVNTVHALKDLFTTIVTHCQTQSISDCTIIITGGSEFGHAGEEVSADGTISCIDPHSHCGGRKIDLRLTEGLESLVATFTPFPTRELDGAPQWKDEARGHIYAREPTHWDILIP